MRTAASDHDTIAAIATPVGEGGLAVVRISGPKALDVADRLFVPAGARGPSPSAAPTHTVHYGHVTRDARPIDEVLLTVLRAPRTFTREDTVEISCHGGVFIARQVLDAVLAAGARLAQPGEFTRRAFVNGRIDLTQAEAVADLIHARTELAVAAAHEQLAGSLSSRVRSLRDALLKTLAHVEAHIDFPDEDIAPDTQRQLLERLDQAIAGMEQLLATAREGRVLRRGIRAAILGRPNAGKSSLLNRLLGQDRAIVSTIAGTTRDTIEETANIRGIPVVFIDTAGLREAADALEEEGIRRTRAAASKAELVLHVLDASQPLVDVDVASLRQFAGQPRILILNKADLPAALTLPPDLSDSAVPVSCATGQGLEDLKAAVHRLVWNGSVGGGMHEVMINARHEDALRRGHTAAVQCIRALRDGSHLDLVAVDLRIALHALGEIVGETTTDDLLDVIFSEFCLGK
ncbi:MAG: tRNA uridine-5-carboxymethylaminomethyl(34) synthesis GTPase MnmE [Limisphaerales bacterium]